MTLSDWSQKYGVQVQTHQSGTLFVVTNEDAAVVGLFNLSDYKVSSRCGPVTWLVPVPAPDEWEIRRDGKHLCFLCEVQALWLHEGVVYLLTEQGDEQVVSGYDVKRVGSV